MNDSERNARRDFHLALPFGIIPGVGALISFALSRRPGDGAWVKRIKQLAGIDLLVLLGAVTLIAFGVPPPPQHAARAQAVGMFVVQSMPEDLKSWKQPWVLVEIGLSLAALGWLALRARAKQISMLPSLLILASLVFATLMQQLAYWILVKKLGGFTSAGWLFSAMVFTSSMLAASAWSLRLAVRRGIVPAPNWNPPQPLMVGRGLLYIVSLGARAGVIAWAVWSATGLLRFLPAGDPWGVADELPRWGALLFALDAVAIAPAAEELLFRGLFLPWLETLFSSREALFLSAAIFGLQHIAYGPGAAFIMVVGLVLGWARQRSGGLSAPLFIHTLNNGLVTLLRLSR